MRSTAYPRRKKLDRKQERRSVWPSVQHKLRDCEERHQSARRDNIRHSGPDGIEDSHECAEDKLLAFATNEIRQKDRNIEAGQVTSAADDDVANGNVP